jgi:hypothetical protein
MALDKSHSYTTNYHLSRGTVILHQKRRELRILRFPSIVRMRIRSFLYPSYEPRLPTGGNMICRVSQIMLVLGLLYGTEGQVYDES